MAKSKKAAAKLDEAKKRGLAAEVQTKAGQKKLAKIKAMNATGLDPELCKAQELKYAAFRTPYLGSGDAPVLTLLAQGVYYPTPASLKMYFVGVYGDANAYQLMQVASDVVFFLATYHAASYSSGAGLLELKDTITIEDAYGTHRVPVLPWP